MGGHGRGVGGTLGGGVAGGDGGCCYGTSGGGGAAAGPAIFVNHGALATAAGCASGSTASSIRFGGNGSLGATDDATPVFNYGGTVNGSTTTGPIATALQQCQSITFGHTPPVHVGGTAKINATGGASGNPVTFSSQTTSICTVSGMTVTGVNPGHCTIAADQAGNADYHAAPRVTHTILVVVGIHLEPH